MHHEPGAGSRGGPLPPLTLEEAQALFGHWKRDEYGWLRTTIVRLAYRHDEFHADYIAAQELTERNMIGAVVNGLCRMGFLTSTGEHRKGRSAASHGRRSYVYRLTERGMALACHLPPAEPGEPSEEQIGLF